MPGSSFAEALPVNGAALSAGLQPEDGEAVAAATPDAPQVEEVEAALTEALDATTPLLAAHDGAETMLVPTPWLTVIKEILGKEELEGVGDGLLVTGTTVSVITGTVEVLVVALYV